MQKMMGGMGGLDLEGMAKKKFVKGPKKWWNLHLNLNNNSIFNNKKQNKNHLETNYK